MVQRGGSGGSGGSGRPVNMFGGYSSTSIKAGKRMATIRMRQVCKEFGLHDRAGRRSAVPWLRKPTPQAREGEIGESARVQALDHVDLTVPDGQTVAVVGPSGCGKSTLLRVVSGLEADYDGELLYDDQNMENVAPKDRFIGMVFQNYALYPHFEGHGNLSFFYRLRKAPDEEIEERIRITSEIMGIGFRALLQRKPGTLSGGQQQRVAIGRAIVRRPRVFLFDEPLSNLDAKLRSQTRVEIRRLLRRFAITALYVTHDQTEAMALGDQVAVMRAGRIEQVGPFAEVRQRPANIFVAGFLGVPPMNLIHNAVVGEGEVSAGDGLRIAPHASQVAALKTGEGVTVGIRPESVVVEVAEGGSAPRPGRQDRSVATTWRGTVEAVEADFGRHIQFVHFQSGEHRLIGQADLRTRIAQGEEITARFFDEDLHFFAAQSGERIG